MPKDLLAGHGQDFVQFRRIKQDIFVGETVKVLPRRWIPKEDTHIPDSPRGSNGVYSLIEYMSFCQRGFFVPRNSTMLQELNALATLDEPLPFRRLAPYAPCSKERHKRRAVLND
jgi:hypothetical protein